jgi:hypothetical protein
MEMLSERTPSVTVPVIGFVPESEQTLELPSVKLSALASGEIPATKMTMQAIQNLLRSHKTPAANDASALDAKDCGLLECLANMVTSLFSASAGFAEIPGFFARHTRKKWCRSNL